MLIVSICMGKSIRIKMVTYITKRAWLSLYRYPVHLNVVDGQNLWDYFHIRADKPLHVTITNWLLGISLRNDFDFWNVHGIMNTSGLLQRFRKDIIIYSKWRLHV